MPHTILYEASGHHNVLIQDESAGGPAVQSNQHLIIHGGVGMILDPGGHKIYRKVLASTLSLLGRSKLRYLFLSHQDPDIVAAVNGWLMTTEADALASALWTRFIPHFGLDRLVADRLLSIPDEGMKLDLGGLELLVIPAHFLHSCGNFQLYDPWSKILYTGDLGASLGCDYIDVPDFGAHVPFMEAFHRRYMGSTAAMKAWVRMVRSLEIETIAPQHGAMIRGRAMVQQFVEWCDQLECGIDRCSHLFKIPE